MKNELPTHLFQQWTKNRIFLSNSLKAKGISAVFQRQDAYKEGVAAGVDQELLQEAAWQIEAEELRSKIKEFPTQLRNFFFEDQHEYIYIYTSLITCEWMNESWDHPWMHPWMNHVIWIYIDSFWRGLQSFVWLRRLWHVEYTILIFWWWARAPKQLRFAASFQLAALAVLDESHLQNAVGEFPKNIQFCHSFWPRCPWNGVWNSGPRKAIMVTRANLIEVHWSITF